MALRAPVAGRDYPASTRAMMAWFSDDDAVAAWLAKVRWHGRFACPKCGSSAWGAFSSQGVGVRRCGDYRKLITPTTGTLFHKARVPLTTWMEAGWLMSTRTNGLSALELERSHIA